MSAYDNNPVLPPSLPLNAQVTGAQLNPVLIAVADLRAALVGDTPSEGGAANWFRFAANLTPPAAGANASVLSTDGVRLLASVNCDIARQVNPYFVSVTDHGADPTGAHDSTVEINNAVARCAALGGVDGVVGMSSYSHATLYFPPGVYKVSNEIGAYGSVFNVEGSNAIIHGTDPTKNILNLHPVGNQVYTVRGLTFYGGLNQIYRNLNNVNNGVCVIRDCILVNPADAGSCVMFDVPDRGTNIVENCFIWTINSLGTMVSALGGDQNIVRNCYVSPGGGTAFIAGYAPLHLENINGAPVTGSGGGGTWIKSLGATVIARNFRFGGEAFLVNVEWRGGGGTLILKHCQAWVEAGTPNFKFYDAPTHVEIDLLEGLGTGIWFDPEMPAAEKRAIANGFYNVRGGLGRSPGNVDLPLVDISSDAYCLGAASNDGMSGHQGDLTEVSDFLLAIPGQSLAFGDNGVDQNVTTTLVTNIFGTQATQKTGGPGGGSAGRNWVLPRLPAGNYTAAIDVSCSTPISVSALFGDTQKAFLLCPGDPCPRIFFTLGAPSQQYWADIGVGLPEGVVATIERIRIFKGRHPVPERRTVLIGNQLPTFGHFQRCDEIINPRPDAGGSPGWICTTGGAATSGAWTQNTRYDLGQQVTSGNGGVYYCSHAGISSGFGTGPMGSGGGIADGTTCTWEFLDSAIAVFKAKPNLAP
jgi:Pectate lyase superfamily protein